MTTTFCSLEAMFDAAGDDGPSDSVSVPSALTVFVPPVTEVSPPTVMACSEVTPVAVISLFWT